MVLWVDGEKRGEFGFLSVTGDLQVGGNLTVSGQSFEADEQIIDQVTIEDDSGNEQMILDGDAPTPFFRINDDNELRFGTDNDGHITYNSSQDEIKIIDSDATEDIIVFPTDGGSRIAILNRGINLGNNSLQNVGSLDVDGDIDLEQGDFDYNQRKQLNVGRKINTVSSNVTTSGEETIFADVSSSGLTVTLASADVFEGSRVKVVDNTGNAGTNNITIDTEGSENINGESSTVINNNFEALTLESDGTNWFIVSRMSGGAT